MSQQTSINLPQLIAVALVGFLAIRWYLSKPTVASPSTTVSSTNRAVDLTKVEQVAAMFPQMDRRLIAWDLNRNGGNVAATTERLLAGRGLDNPPPSYQPNIPVLSVPATGVDARAVSSTMSTRQSDLITRYGLQRRIDGKGKERVPSEEQTKNVWSSDKVARAEGLKRRREEMILAARRKMETEDKTLV